MMPDTRVVGRDGAFTVLGERQAVTFRDLSVVHLHRVQRDDVDSTYHRAFCLNGTHWCVFDLRSLHRDFAIDFPTLLARDHSGVVLYTLRAAFVGDASFIAKAFEEFTHVWPVPAEPTLNLPRDVPAGRVVFQPELPRASA